MFQKKENWIGTRYETPSWRFYTRDLSFLFLDIETTGLSSAHHASILTGLGFPTPNGLSITQYFAQNLTEERDILESTYVDLCQNPFWITYNGTAFDLPFLEKRMSYHGIATQLPLHQSFDLYRIIKRFSPFGQFLPNLKQKTIEEFLGLSSGRTDTISGKESVQFYEQYLDFPCEEWRNLILLHNRDDVVQLSRLLQVLSKLDLHRIMCNLGFFVVCDEKKIRIEQIKPTLHGVTVIGHGSGISLNYQNYGLAYEATYDASSGQFHLWIPAQQERGCAFFDLENFDMDCSDLRLYDGYESGFLLYKKENQLAYNELNHLLKLLISHILTMV